MFPHASRPCRASDSEKSIGRRAEPHGAGGPPSEADTIAAWSARSGDPGHSIPRPLTDVADRGIHIDVPCVFGDGHLQAGSRRTLPWLLEPVLIRGEDKIPMLGYDELASLSHLLRDERVLSVYIDGTAHDPAVQRAWRLQLDHSLDDLRRWLEGSSHTERVAFEHCVTLLEGQLALLSRGVGAPGWVGFITHRFAHVAEPLPVPMPTFAVWSTGMCLAPYMRALKQTRPATIVVADARKARIYGYGRGKLTSLATLHAHAVTEPPEHMGAPPRQGFHSGTRGATGHDEAQRSLEVGTHRMVDEVVRTLTRVTGLDGWILVGGIPHTAAEIVRAVEPVAAGRVLQLESLDIHATDAQIEAAVQKGTSQLRDAADQRRIAEIIDHEEAEALATLGAAATRRALERVCVRELYLTPRYLQDHLAEAEGAVRAALAQGATVEEVSRQVAAKLDERGGMAARLRYRIPEVEGAESDTSETVRPELAASGSITPR